MAPSITETLYALGLGDRVVGVARDCHYPPEVENVKKTGNVGGYYDPNLEAILALKPDLVIMLEEQALALPNFEKLKLETLVVSHQTIDGIIESFRTIGRKCGKGPEGRRMAREFQNRVDRIRQQTRAAVRVRGCSSCSIGPSAAATRRSLRRRRRQLHRHDHRLGRRAKRLSRGAASAIRSFRPKAS